MITSAVGGGGLPGEAKRVADVVGDVLDLGALVVVGQDDRVPGFCQAADLRLKRRDLVRRLLRRFDHRKPQPRGLSRHTASRFSEAGG